VSACSRDLIKEADFAKVKKGMSQQQVQDMFGTPNSIKTEGAETRLNYRTSDGPQDIILTDGEVSGTSGRWIMK